jgi:hypothetical protein
MCMPVAVEQSNELGFIAALGITRYAELDLRITWFTQTIWRAPNSLRSLLQLLQYRLYMILPRFALER